MAEEFLWWRDGIIYQIYPRSFCDSNGDGFGDLPGITSKLDYLHDLGVDAIWLSPIYPSLDKDFGYDVSDYEGIDPRYGTMADFDELVQQAHSRHIHVVMDMVFNHTSDQHPWFLKSKSGKQNPYRNWYMWQPPKSGNRRPNNWQSVFGGDGWEWDESTQEYFFHMFVKEQPDLNWRNPAVRRAVLEVFRFWMDRGVDGFRLDVFNAYFKDKQFQDNPIKFGLRAFDRQQHIHDVDQPEMMPLLAELRELLDAYPDRYAVGETFLATPAGAAAYVGEKALHAAFNFHFSSSGWSAFEFLNSILIWEGALGKAGWPNYVLNNHDTVRTTTRYKMDDTDEQAKLTALFMLTLRGTPFLYYGEEIGMRDIQLKRSEILDPAGRKYWPLYKGRDGCRSPMQWSAELYAGFSTAQPWMKVHTNYSSRNVETQQDDQNTLFNFYRKVIRMRREIPALTRGDWTPMPRLHSRVLAYQRTYNSQTLTVLLNFSALPIPIQADIRGDVILSTHSRPMGDIIAPISLSPYEGIVIRN